MPRNGPRTSEPLDRVFGAGCGVFGTATFIETVAYRNAWSNGLAPRCAAIPCDVKKASRWRAMGLHRVALAAGDTQPKSPQSQNEQQRIATTAMGSHCN